MRIDVVHLSCDDQAVEGGGPLPAAVGTGEQPRFSAQRYTAQGSFRCVVRQADAAVIKEQGEGHPTLQDVIHRLGEIVAARQLWAVLEHPGFKISDQRRAQFLPHLPPPFDTLAVDRALDLEQRVDAPDRLQRQRRDHTRRFSLRPCGGRWLRCRPARRMADERAPSSRLDDRRRPALGFVQFVVPGIGIGLKDAGIAGEVLNRMCTAAVARIVEHRGRRRRAAERPVVAHINPTSAEIGLAPRQYRHRRVVAVQSFGGKDMRLDPLDQRRQDRATRTDLVGQCRQAERHALPA